MWIPAGWVQAPHWFVPWSSHYAFVVDPESFQSAAAAVARVLNSLGKVGQHGWGGVLSMDMWVELGLKQHSSGFCLHSTAVVLK